MTLCFHPSSIDRQLRLRRQSVQRWLRNLTSTPNFAAVAASQDANALTYQLSAINTEYSCRLLIDSLVGSGGSSLILLINLNWAKNRGLNRCYDTSRGQS